MSISRKFKRNIERQEIIDMTGIKPKTKCPKCGKITVFRVVKNDRYCVKCGKKVNK